MGEREMVSAKDGRFWVRRYPKGCGFIMLVTLIRTLKSGGATQESARAPWF